MFPFNIAPVSDKDRLELLVDHIEDYAIFMLDADGVIRTWNAGAERLAQFRPDEAIGRHLSILQPAEDQAAGKPARLLAAAAQHGRVEDEGWRRRKDGSRFWANVILSAIRDPGGGLIGFAAVTRDLSERRSAEENLRRSEDRFRLLVESVKDYAIFMLDPDGFIQTWNDGARRIKRYEAVEAIGKHMSMFYPPEDAAAGKPQRLLARAAEEGRVEDEGIRVRKDGSRFWADVSITALRDPHGKLLGFAKLTRDLTERKRAEEERLRLAQAEEALRLRDEFLGIASHELKTPLTAMQLQMEAARRGLEGKSGHRLERALRSGMRLAELIETLLDVSRIVSGRLSLAPEPADLRDLAQEVVERMTPAAAHAGVPLSLDLDGPVPGRWDPLRMSQVITNLLSNAIKYGQGSPVSVALRRRAERAALEVSDGGPGIPPQDLERIFGRFERAASARNYGGLGLGLYVSRQIVEAHGGRIHAENRPEGGALFIVDLPLHAVAASEAEELH